MNNETLNKFPVTDWHFEQDIVSLVIFYQIWKIIDFSMIKI